MKNLGSSLGPVGAVFDDKNLSLTRVQQHRNMSDGFVEPDDGDDGDDPDGQGLPGAVEVDVLVAGDPSFVASWDKVKYNDYDSNDYKEPSS